MKKNEKEMTDEEKALSRFEMDGATVSWDVEEAAKEMRECLETLRKEGKIKKR